MLLKYATTVRNYEFLILEIEIPSFAKFADKNYYTGQVFVELLVFESTKKSEKSCFCKSCISMKIIILVYGTLIQK